MARLRRESAIFSKMGRALFNPQRCNGNSRMRATEFKNICVMGLGYIGLPTASLLATKGFNVFGVDVREQIVSTINDGKIHIVEPDLDILVKSAVQSGQLKAG